MRPSTVREVTPPQAVSIEVLESEPALSAAPEPLALPRQRQRSTTRPVVARPAPAPLSTANSEAPADAPRRPLTLTPSARALGEASAPVGTSGGRTVYPDDPMFSPEQKLREAEARVGARTQAFAEDAVGRAITRAGAVPAYLAELDARLEQGMDSAKGGSPAELGGAGPALALVQSYLSAAEQYARTGNPGGPTPAPGASLTERLQSRFSNTPQSLPLQMMAQASETQDALRSRSAQLSLQLELEQDLRGSLVSAAIVQSSGNARFDRFVLEVGKTTLASSGPPPQWLVHGPRLRSLWLVEGWLKPSKALAEALAWVPKPFAVGSNSATPLPIDLLAEELSKGHAHYEFRATLLRAF